MCGTLKLWMSDITAKSNLLRSLMGKDTYFQWSSDHKDEFKRLKRSVSGVNGLSKFNPALPLHLMCDALREGGLGFCFLQPCKGRSNILQCRSTSLSEVQKGYSVTELVLLGISWALSKVEYFVKGAPRFVVMTDHQALVGLEKRSFLW